MKIGIEIRQIIMGVSGGITPLVKGVLEDAIGRNPRHEYYLYTTIFNRGLLDISGDNVHFHTLSIENFWVELDNLALHQGIEVLFRPYPGGHLKQFPLSKQVVLIPDIQHEFFPEFFDSRSIRVRRDIFAPVLRHAGAIGTISEYARKTLVEFPQTSCDDIFLMPPAAQVSLDDEAEEAGAEFRERMDAIGPFFFYPANLWSHKNHKRLLEAFEIFRKNSRHDIALVLTGYPSGWDGFESAHAHLPVHHLGFVSKAELRHLYRHAVALTFFSLYEGFGMPLLEAFEFDCPVICSNTTSLPEVGGNAVLSCDPTRPEEMARLMAEVAASEDIRKQMAAKGRSRLGVYTWKSSADAFMDALERVARCPKPATALPPEPVVSIVTPSYNQAEFLQRTIESVLNQTYPHIEYIVVDGGSTDGSVAILEQYGDRFRWSSEPDEGQTDAINKGFELSRGQIRGYLNSDDTLPPDAIETVVQFFRDNPNCDMVYGDGDYIDLNDQVSGTYATAEYSFDRLMFDCCVCQPAAFWRTDMAFRVGPFDASLHYVMDYDYWLRIDRAGGQIRYLPKVLGNSRLYAETKTLSARSKIFQEIFTICYRHGGYVNLNYFIGYWHYLLLERSRIVAGVIQRVPKAWKLAAFLHHKWFHRSYYLGLIRNGALRPSLKTGLQRVLPRRRSGVLSAPARKGIDGFWGDNWFEPVTRVTSDNVKLNNTLYLVGTAATNCVLDIDMGSRHVQQVRLKTGETTRVEFASDHASRQVTFRFDRSIVDASSRKIAFHLLETNLFAESDLHS